MFKKFFDGLAWGAGFGISLLVLLALSFGFFEWWLPIFAESDADGPAEWSNFSVLNSSHRFVVGTRYNDGLHISGELEFNEDLPFDRFWINAIVRDEDGALIENCSEKYVTGDLFSMTVPFVLKCDSIVEPSQFVSYDFVISRWYQVRS